MKKKNTKDIAVPRILSDDTPFAIREAFNLLRTNLMYTLSDSTDGAPIYAVTSTTESAGKSTVIVNLAISFAQLNKKVLIIDGDMRRPVIHTYLDIDSRVNGLSELISGINNDVTIKNVRPNLDVITSGRIPPNPSELIISPRFEEYLNAWKKEYDIIFIDFPPIGIVTDAIANCKIVNGYIFVVRSGRCNAKSINACIESMEQVGAKIVGVVLNDYNIKGSSNYSRGNSRYSKQTISKYETAAKQNSSKGSDK